LSDRRSKKKQGELKTDKIPAAKVEKNPLPASKTKTQANPSSPSITANPKQATLTDSTPQPQPGNTVEGIKEAQTHQQAAVPEPAPQNQNPNTGTGKERSLPGLTTSIRRRKIQADDTSGREATTKEAVKTEEHFSEENLIEAWLRFAGTLKDDPYLSNSMQACKPRLLNKSDFEVVVFHPLTAQRLEAIRADIENSLQRDLKNGKVHMQLRISEEGELKKPLSPQDQLDEMIKKNPNLQSLRQKLSLELQ